MSRIFLLSPAWCGGKRAAMLRREAATFPLATRLRGQAGAPLSEVFSFLSGLYFRGKLAYAREFAPAAALHPGLLIITPTRGLVPPDTAVRVTDLGEFASVDIDEGDARYTVPLRRDLEPYLGDPAVEVVLLGSIATGKYVQVLAEALGERLLFPVDFVGRGDMSRGGLLLRAARARRELPYAPVLGAVRHGVRPPRLERMR